MPSRRKGGYGGKRHRQGAGYAKQRQGGFPMRQKRNWAHRGDMAKFTHDSSYIWTPKDIDVPGGTLEINPANTVQNAMLTNYISINPSNPFSVFPGGRTLQENADGTFQPRDWDDEDFYGGHGYLVRDDIAVGGPSTLTLHNGTWGGSAGTGVAGAFPPNNACGQVLTVVGDDPSVNSYRGLIVKSCKVIARITPERAATHGTENGGAKYNTNPAQTKTNFYIGSSDSPRYMSSNPSNAIGELNPRLNSDYKALPYVTQSQTKKDFSGRGGSDKSTVLSTTFDTARKFGVVDIEDTNSFLCKYQPTDASVPVNSPPSIHSPDQQGVIQIAWRSAYDAAENMPGIFELDGTNPAQLMCMPLTRFKIDIHVEYTCILKMPLVKANIPRPIFFSGYQGYQPRHKHVWKGRRRMPASMYMKYRNQAKRQQAEAWERSLRSTARRSAVQSLAALTSKALGYIS